MRNFFLLLGATLFTCSLSAQEFTTRGDQSPIIKGVRAKIKYESSQNKQIDLPEYLIPYLSGILILNEKNPTEVNEALDIWIQKYGELKSKILSEEEENIRNQALQSLNRGNFPAVEDLLGTSSDYQKLEKVFPNSFVTKGKESPIIIGDYASVTYAVNTVIEYKLPEGLTLNLLNQLYRKENLVVKLNRILDSRERTIRRWVTQYKELELQLQRTPSAIAQEAYRYFQVGDLEKTLEILEKLSGTEKEIANARLLKAKLLMLNIGIQNLEKSLEEIEKSFEVCIALDPNFRAFLDFGIFLADYRGNFVKASEPLLKALKLATTPKEKIEVLHYLGFTYSTMQNQALLSEKYCKEGLEIFNEIDEASLDSSLIERKIKMLGNLSVVNASLNRLPDAFKYSEEAIKLMDRLPDNFTYQNLRASLWLGKARTSYLAKDYATSKASYEKAIKIYEGLYETNQEKIGTNLATAYYYYSEIFYNENNPLRAQDYLRKARKLIEPYLSAQSPSIIYSIQSIFNALYQTHRYLSQKTDALELTEDFEKLILPLREYNEDFYKSYWAAAQKEKGSIHLELKETAKALPYLEAAYDYYKNNLGLYPGLFTSNLSDCFLKVSQIYYSQNQKEKALNFSKDALKHLALVSKYDSVNYRVFKNLAYNQLAQLYYNYEQNDSSFFYANKGFQSGRKIVIRYPEYYYLSYRNSVNYLTLSLKGLKRFQEAISVYQAYLTTILDLVKYNPAIKQTYWMDYINYTKFLGDTFREINDYLHAEHYYYRTKRLLEEEDLINNQGYKYNYASILESLAWYCEDRSEKIKKKKVARIYREKKCEYAKQAKDIFKQFPPNPQLQQSIFNMSKLSNECGP